jgi:acyl-CoA thioesterase I
MSLSSARGQSEEGGLLNHIPGASLLVLSALLIGCSSSQTARSISTESAQPAAPNLAPDFSEPDLRPLIVAFGDSLTAGLGVAPEGSYPGKLQRRINASGYKFKVVNAGVSGDTSSQGVNRLQTIIAMRPALVIVELGANDGLRGLPVEATRANLETIVGGLQKEGVEVIVAGMEMPPNYGPVYTSSFRKIFPEVAAKYRAVLMPFFLEGVGGHPELNQADGLHPTEDGYSMVVDNIWRVVEPLLKKLQGGTAQSR